MKENSVLSLFDIQLFAEDDGSVLDDTQVPGTTQAELESKITTLTEQITALKGDWEAKESLYTEAMSLVKDFMEKQQLEKAQSDNVKDDDGDDDDNNIINLAEQKELRQLKEQMKAIQDDIDTTRATQAAQTIYTLLTSPEIQKQYPYVDNDIKKQILEEMEVRNGNIDLLVKLLQRENNKIESAVLKGKQMQITDKKLPITGGGSGGGIPTTKPQEIRSIREAGSIIKASIGG